jgi:hypothetical protein
MSESKTPRTEDAAELEWHKTVALCRQHAETECQCPACGSWFEWEFMNDEFEILKAKLAQVEETADHFKGRAEEFAKKLADLESQIADGELVPFEAIQYWIAFEHGLNAPVHPLHKPDLNNPKTGMPWRFKEVYQLWREEQCAKERKY